MEEGELYTEITKLIVDLLPSSGCMIIPDVGGFITYNVSARIDQTSNRIYPPSGRVGFNSALKVNDGLLASHYALLKGISYPQALDKIQRFTFYCISELNAGKILHFASLGNLRHDNTKNLIFEPDPHTNFLDDAFGLAPVSAMPVRRKLAEVGSMAHNRKHFSRFRTHNVAEGLKWTLMILPILLLALYSVYQTGVLDGVVNYSSLGGNISQQPIDEKAISNPYTIEPRIPHIEKKFQPEEYSLNRIHDAFTDTVFPVIVLNADIMRISSSKEKSQDRFDEYNAKVSVTNENSMASSQRFHLIAGCFKDINNAYRLRDELRQKGFDATLAGTSSLGLTRVSIASFFSKQDAQHALNEFKTKSFQDLWILKI